MKTPKEIKPLYSMHHEYRESLDQVLLEAIKLVGTCETLLDLGQVGGGADKLRERVNALKAALGN